MEPLAKLLVSVLELAETELAMLKRSAIRFALSIAMVIGAAVFGIIGLCWVIEGLFEALIKLTNSRPLAFLIAGVVFLAVAAILGVMAFAGKKQPKVAAPNAKPPTHSEGKSDEPASLRMAS